jgi:hypothetical protein
MSATTCVSARRTVWGKGTPSCAIHRMLGASKCRPSARHARERDDHSRSNGAFRPIWPAVEYDGGVEAAHTREGRRARGARAHKSAKLDKPNVLVQSPGKTLTDKVNTSDQ